MGGLGVVGGCVGGYVGGACGFLGRVSSACGRVVVGRLWLVVWGWCAVLRVKFWVLVWHDLSREIIPRLRKAGAEGLVE